LAYFEQQKVLSLSYYSKIDPFKYIDPENLQDGSTAGNPKTGPNPAATAVIQL